MEAQLNTVKLVARWGFVGLFVVFLILGLYGLAPVSIIAALGGIVCVAPPLRRIAVRAWITTPRRTAAAALTLFLFSFLGLALSFNEQSVKERTAQLEKNRAAAQTRKKDADAAAAVAAAAPKVERIAWRFVKTLSYAGVVEAKNTSATPLMKATVVCENYFKNGAFAERHSSDIFKPLGPGQTRLELARASTKHRSDIDFSRSRCSYQDLEWATVNPRQIPASLELTIQPGGEEPVVWVENRAQTDVVLDDVRVSCVFNATFDVSREEQIQEAVRSDFADVPEEKESKYDFNPLLRLRARYQPFEQKSIAIPAKGKVEAKLYLSESDVTLRTERASVVDYKYCWIAK
jgi:hypothetical protein